MVTVVTDHAWQAYNADRHRKPAPPKGGKSSAGNRDFLENIDARAEPIDWTTSAQACRPTTLEPTMGTRAYLKRASHSL